MDWCRSVTDAGERARLIEKERAYVVAASAAAPIDDAKGERELLLARALAHPRDARIRFHEESHSYFLDGVRVPLSVSGIYSKYFGHFDAPGVIRKNADKWRSDPSSKYFPILRVMESLQIPAQRQFRVIEEAWAANGNHQSALGTALHRAIELRLNEESIPESAEDAPQAVAEDALCDELVGDVFNLPRTCAASISEFARTGARVSKARTTLPVRTDVQEFAYFEAWRMNRPELVPIRCEWSIWSEELQVAGQLDALFWDALRQQWVMVDWKRAKLMEMEAFGGRTGKPPCDAVADTNYGHYTIQQNLYAGLLERHYGVRVEKMILLQLHPNYDGAIEHEVPRLDDVVKSIFDDRLRDVAASPKRIRDL